MSNLLASLFVTALILLIVMNLSFILFYFFYLCYRTYSSIACITAVKLPVFSTERKDNTSFKWSTPSMSNFPPVWIWPLWGTGNSAHSSAVTWMGRKYKKEEIMCITCCVLWCTAETNIALQSNPTQIKIDKIN